MEYLYPIKGNIEGCMSNRQSLHPYHTCTFCNVSWSSQKEFLSDPAIELIGYYPNFKDINFGFFLFLHGGSCGTTASIYVTEFLHLYTGPIYTEKLNNPRLEDEGFKRGRFEIDCHPQQVHPLEIQYTFE